MDEHCKSLAFQFDLFLNNTLNLLDTKTERDYLEKLKLMEELSSRINESKNDKKTIKSSLEKIQDECSKLHFQLKTSARLLDEVQAGKEKLEIENENMKYQLDQFYNVFKKPDAVDKIQTHYSNRSDCLKQDEKKTLNNTDALLSDLSFSVSEDSSYEIKKIKRDSAPVKKNLANNNPNVISKLCQVENGNTNGRQIIATTTLTMDLDNANFKSLNMDLNGVNVKSVTKTHPITSSKSLLSSSSDSDESLSSDEPEKEFTPKTSNVDKNYAKKHNFVQKFVVLPEICSHCHKKIKFSNCMVKCEDCKIITHLECKDLIPDSCSFDQNQIYTLNFDILPLIVHCINEIEKRGLETVGLYRVSGSDKEVQVLRDKFRQGVSNLNDVDIHIVCGCLKYFISMQKNHLISQNDFMKIANALKKDGDVSKLFHQGVLEISSTNRKILAFLILHLKKVASSPKCHMDYRCLAIVFGPIFIGVSSSTSLIELHNDSEIINKVVIELLKLSESFWYSLVKTDNTSSDELLHSTPTQSKPQTLKTAYNFFSPGKKKRILDSPTQNRAAKQVKYKKLN